ncbi:MAG: hypothetical protein VKJ24_06540, partial [Synechococcales bacterium]|nr:hypothetical protein [Synechococcales bacterium]
YEVIPIPLEIIPNYIDLGSISYIRRERNGKILVNLKKIDSLKIKGYATSSDPSILKIFPYEFDNTKEIDNTKNMITQKIEYRVFPRSSTVGIVNVEVIIEVNGDKYFVPIRFNAGIDYFHQFLSNFPLSISLAVLAGCTRYIIEKNLFPAIYELLSIIVILGLFYLASFHENLLNFLMKLTLMNSSTLTRGNKKLSKSNLAFPAEGYRIISIFLGIFVSWILNILGYLKPISTLLVYLLDFISLIFYIIGIQSPNWQWGILTYIGINAYLIINAQIKLRRDNVA